MQSRLIVHVGMPKTGTTSIQNYLYDHNSNLKEMGYDYPDLIREMTEAGYRVNCRNEGRKKNGVALGIFRRWDNYRAINESYEQAWQVFEDIIKDHLKYASVIISDEDLWSQGNNFELIRRFKKLCNNTEIVVYLRRQDLMIEALWNQVVKRYGYSTDDFERGKNKWLGSRTLNYLELLDAFSEIVGQDRMHIRVYEKQQLAGGNGDVIEDFFDVLGIEKKGDFKSTHESENDRLSGSLLNIKQAMNRSLSKEEWISGVIEEYFMDTVEKYGTTQKKESYFTDKERLSVLEGFEEENTNIAKKYLNRQTGRLFYDVVKSNQLHTEEIDIKDVIQVFTHIALEQEKKFNFFSMAMRRMINFKISDLTRRRKLTVFGAGLICRRFLDICDQSVDLIIDNDRSKSGLRIMGHSIVHPSEISDWKDRYILVASGAYDEIKHQLDSFGLEEYKDYLSVTEVSMIH